MGLTEYQFISHQQKETFLSNKRIYPRLKIAIYFGK